MGLSINERRRLLSLQPTDEAVVEFMSTVYLWMGLGIGLAAFTAYEVGTHPMMQAELHGTWLVWPTLLAPFGISLLLGTRARKMHPAAAGFWFLVLTATMGTWFSTIVLKATEDPAFAQNVYMALITTTAMFVGMAVVGWTTRKDLQEWGTFFLSALLGLIVALILNRYFQSDIFSFLTSIAGVILFSGLIAYDVQRAKNNAHHGFGGAILSALDLILDFFNLMLHILRLLGFSSSSSDD